MLALQNDPGLGERPEGTGHEGGRVVHLRVVPACARAGHGRSEQKQRGSGEARAEQLRSALPTDSPRSSMTSVMMCGFEAAAFPSATAAAASSAAERSSIAFLAAFRSTISSAATSQ